MHAGLEEELALTVTHLVTMYDAIRTYTEEKVASASAGSSRGGGGDARRSKWAIISHDHAQFPLDVDWQQLFDSVPTRHSTYSASATAKKEKEKEEKEKEEKEPALLLLTNPHVGLAKQLWWKRIHNVTLYNQWSGADTAANLATILW